MYSVVLVDDEPWTLRGLKETLPWNDYHLKVVRSFTDPIKALDYIISSDPDVVLSDIRMPGMSGMELMERIRKSKASSIVVIVSGFSDFHYVQSAIREGALDYLLKPIEESQGMKLLIKLENVLKSSAGHGIQVNDHASATKGINPGESMKSLYGVAIENRQFSVLVDYVMNNYTSPQTLKELSERFGLNPSYSSQLFKQYYSISYSRFITKLRMEKAQLLLRNEALTVLEVAELTGYSDYYYFNKLFKKHFGITPTRYRKESL